MCEGFNEADVPPSPKVQLFTAFPMLVLVKVVSNGEQPAIVFIVKPATGRGLTVMVFLTVSPQPAPVDAISITV